MKPIQDTISLSPEASAKLAAYLAEGSASDEELTDEQLFARDRERRLQAMHAVMPELSRQRQPA